MGGDSELVWNESPRDPIEEWSERSPPMALSSPVPEASPARTGRLESRFDIAFLAALALREKQVQQNYRPVIAVHKWFSRRPGTLFRGMLLAEFGSGPVRDSFFRPASFPGLKI